MKLEFAHDARHYRKLRQYAFVGMAGLVLVLLAALILWLRSVGQHLFEGTLQTDASHTALFLTPLVVIASLIAISVLPTMRLVFRDKAKDESDKPAIGIWQPLLTELADIVKQYLGRNKSAA
jgi:hypothetical protein